LHESSTASPMAPPVVEPSRPAGQHDAGPAWRALRDLGAGSLRDGVSVLPASEAARAAFEASRAMSPPTPVPPGCWSCPNNPARWISPSLGSSIGLQTTLSWPAPWRDSSASFRASMRQGRAGGCGNWTRHCPRWSAWTSFPATPGAGAGRPRRPGGRDQPALLPAGARSLAEGHRAAGPGGLPGAHLGDPPTPVGGPSSERLADPPTHRSRCPIRVAGQPRGLPPGRTRL